MASSWRRSTYSRCDLSMSSATSSRILPAQLDLGQRVTRPGEGALEPQLDVERLEQLDLALQREVGRVAGGVRERAGVLDRAQERDDAAGTARLEDLLDHDAVLACELVCVLADLVGVGVLGHGDAQCTADALALALAELGTVQGADGGAAVAARQHGRLAVELGDHADRRELAVAAGGDDDPRRAVGRQCVIEGGASLVTGDRDRDRHVREDHAVVERE